MFPGAAPVVLAREGKAGIFAAMDAVIISIGSELTLGATVDTNSAWLAQRLAELGILVRAHETIADEQQAISEAIDRASRRADVVLVTGGLGPTGDDRTREGAPSGDSRTGIYPSIRPVAERPSSCCNATISSISSPSTINTNS